MRHYVTTAAAPHLPQLRVLHASMRRHCKPFKLHVLAEGEEVAAWAREQDDVEYTKVSLFTRMRDKLAPDCLPGPLRPRRELAWTWRWWFARDVVDCYGVPVTVLDVDLMFFSSPEPVFEEIGLAPMAVLPHAFAPAARGLPGVTHETHRRFGLFNAGLVYFADPTPLQRMADLCREGPMYADRVHDDGVTRWGEQGNLERVAGEAIARVIRHPGAAPGPWNIHTQPLARDERGALTFGGRPLVAYHYSSLRLGGQLADAPYEITARQAELLYAHYLAALAATTPKETT